MHEGKQTKEGVVMETALKKKFRHIFPVKCVSTTSRCLWEIAFGLNFQNMTVNAAGSSSAYKLVGRIPRVLHGSGKRHHKNYIDESPCIGKKDL